MKRLFLLFIPILLGLTSCNKFTPEQAEEAVIKGERDRLPLLIQTISIVDDITIDSIRLNVTVEPMHGYLYTTWKKKKKATPIIVEVDSICAAEQRGYVQWKTNWDNASRAYIMKTIGFSY